MAIDDQFSRSVPRSAEGSPAPIAGPAGEMGHSDSAAPILSVIIPHRNTPEKLRCMLESIPGQYGIEVIVVDDNSDPSKSAFSVKDVFPSVRFISNSCNERNAGSARNCGLETASGIWVMFADADDYFVPGAFESVLGSLASSHDSDCVYFKCTSTSRSDATQGSRHDDANALVDACLAGDEVTIRYRWHSPWAKALRRSMLNAHQIRFDSILAGNDVMFSTKAGHFAKSIHCVDRVVYCITTSEGSLSATLTEERALARVSALSRHNLLLMEWGVDTKLDFGVTYFLASRPWAASKRKLSIYKLYLFMWARRIFRMPRKRHLRHPAPRPSQSAGVRPMSAPDEAR